VSGRRTPSDQTATIDPFGTYRITFVEPEGGSKVQLANVHSLRGDNLGAVLMHAQISPSRFIKDVDEVDADVLCEVFLPFQNLKAIHKTLTEFIRTVEKKESEAVKKQKKAS